MSTTSETSPVFRWRLPTFAALLVLVGGMAWLRVERPVTEARMEELVLQDGILRWSGSQEVFNGRLVSREKDGHLRSASEVKDGRLHGLSEGWHENGTLQVSERFLRGSSNGLRTKWRADGTRESEAEIRNGRLDGRFTRWNESGLRIEEAFFKDGVPVGEARQWHPDGSLRSWCRLESGRPVESKQWSPGECHEWPVHLAKSR